MSIAVAGGRFQPRLMTPAQQTLIDQLTRALGGDPRIRALWLSGSLGKGQGDAWSDIDLTALVEEADIRPCLDDYAAGYAGMPPTVLTHEVYGRVFAATTPDWDRFDIVFHTPAEIARMNGAGLKLLLGDHALTPPSREAPADTGAARRVEALAKEFLRILGLLPVAVGRGEWVVAQQGVELLRKMLVDLMLEENGIGPGQRGGAKRLNPFLTPEQRGLLEAIPLAASNGPSLIAANRAHAQPFLARARALSDRLGAAWPQALEEATRLHLRTTLGLEI